MSAVSASRPRARPGRELVEIDGLGAEQPGVRLGQIERVPEALLPAAGRSRSRAWEWPGRGAVGRRTLEQESEPEAAEGPLPGRPHRELCAARNSRVSSRRSSFPMADLGSASRNSTCFGIL